MTDNNNFLPAVPDPGYVAIALGLVRGLLQIAAGCGFTWAVAVTGDQMAMAASALVMLATLLWSAWQKIKATRRVRQAAVESATRTAAASAYGGPVPVAVVPAAPAGTMTTAELNRAELARVRRESSDERP